MFKVGPVISASHGIGIASMSVALHEVFDFLWKYLLLNETLSNHICRVQRWSRRHKAQGQGHKKNPRPKPRTALPRTDPLEAKDSNAWGQSQGPRTQAQVLSKKRSSEKIFRRSPEKNVFQKNFQALHKLLTTQKIVLSSSRGQFSRTWGFEAKDLSFEAKAKNFKMCPRRRPWG